MNAIFVINGDTVMIRQVLEVPRVLRIPNPESLKLSFVPDQSIKTIKTDTFDLEFYDARRKICIYVRRD